VTASSTDFGGVFVDLGQQIVSTDSNMTYNTTAAMVYKSGSVSQDELVGVESIVGSQGSDIIIGSGLNEILEGGSGSDTLTGGLGDDTFVSDGSTGLDLVTDFQVAGMLSSHKAAPVISDRFEFSLDSAALTSAFGQGTDPASITYTVQASPHAGDTYLLELIALADSGTQATIDSFEVELNESTVTALYGSDVSQFGLVGFIHGGDVRANVAGSSLTVGLELERLGQVVDSSDEVGVYQSVGDTDDIFVATQGDDVVIGGLGSDTYESRIIASGSGVSTPINNGTETINDFGGVADSDILSFEGVRDLGDLDFDRVTLRREGDGRSMEIDYRQYRGVDDPSTVGDETGSLYAFGTVEVFNQFSTSMGGVYAIEGVSIAEESANPLDAAVHSYLFGSVSASDLSGDLITASAGHDSIMIGSSGKIDQFVIESTSNGSEQQEVWIYGLSDGTAAFDQEDVVISLNGSSSLAGSLLATDVTAQTLAGGASVKKVSLTLDHGDSNATNDSTLDIIFADAGNVDSQSLIDRLKFES